MARDIPNKLSAPNGDADFNGQTVYFLKKYYKTKQGEEVSVTGPFFKKPAIKKAWARFEITAVIEEYFLVKK